MTIADYFQRPDAERVLLVEIERNTSPAKTYYVADSFYVTEPTDTPANTIYTPAIGGNGLPEFRRTLNAPFIGNASTSFGTLQLSDTDIAFRQGATSNSETISAPKGAKVRMYLAAPRREFPRSDAILLAMGNVQRSGGSSDGSFSIEVTDNREIVISSLFEVGTKPVTYGLARNMTPALIDPSVRRYFVHDGAIEAIDAVYDDGVTLAPAQYTVNLADGSFTLANAPVGRITADVRGAKVGGVWLESTQQIITDILSRAGVSGFTLNFSLPSGRIGHVIRETTNVAPLLDALCLGCGGYWLVNRLGELDFRQFPVASGMGEVYTVTDILGDVTFESQEELFDVVRYTYRQNWTVFQPRVGSTAPIAAFVQKQAEEGDAVASGTDPELEYMQSPVLRTFFDDQANALAVADALIDLYSQPRRFYSLVVPYFDATDLGSTVTIMVDDIEATGVVTEMADVFDGAYPVKRLRVLA